jgi:hypothetical protein
MQKKAAAWFLGGMGVAFAMSAGIAYAADARFDEAISNINKATALLKAAEIPAGKTKALADRHNKRAQALLDRAKQRIECAKDASDGKKVVICKDKDD